MTASIPVWWRAGGLILHAPFHACCTLEMGDAGCSQNLLVTVCAQVRGENDKVNVKRLPKRPAPPRFGRKLTARQRELATHICVGEQQLGGETVCLYRIKSSSSSSDS